MVTFFNPNEPKPKLSLIHNKVLENQKKISKYSEGAGRRCPLLDWGYILQPLTIMVKELSKNQTLIENNSRVNICVIEICVNKKRSFEIIYWHLKGDQAYVMKQRMSKSHFDLHPKST